MQNFTTLIVDMAKKEKLFARQGGPIIITQVLTLFPRSFLVYFCSRLALVTVSIKLGFDVSCSTNWFCALCNSKLAVTES